MKKRIRPSVGMRFILKGSEFEIVFISRGVIRYASNTGGRQFKMDLDRFHILLEKAEITLTDPHVDGQISLLLAPQQLRQKRYVVAVVSELKYPTSHRLLKPLIGNISQQISDPGPPSVRTVARWVKKYFENNKEIEVDSFGKGNRSYRYSVKVEMLLNEAIDKVFLVSERREAKDVLAYIVGKLYESEQLDEHHSEIKIPTLRTIQRRLALLDPFDIEKSKGGTRNHEREFRASGRKIISSELMSIVEVDTHYLDLVAIDKSINEALGRPCLTMIFEIKTRVVVGVHISIFRPSTITVLAAFKDMLTRPNRGLRGGICSFIVPDNGCEFVNCGFEKACASLLITIISSQVGEPNGKPHIESMFSNLTNGIIQKLPGTTFSNPKQRDGYDSVKNAVFDIEDIKSFIFEWIEDVYHTTIHSQTKRIPAAHWDELASEARIQHLSNTEAELLIRRPIERVINNGRIVFDHIYYFSHALKTLENNGLKNVTVLVDDLDLNNIVVEHTTDKKSLIIAESTDPEYTSNLTRHEHKQAMAIKNEMSEADLNNYGKYANLIALYRLISRVQETAIKSRKELKSVANGCGNLNLVEQKISAIIGKVAKIDDVSDALGVSSEPVRASPDVPQNERESTNEVIRFNSFMLEQSDD